MSIKIKNNKKGFSLGEIILSIFILGVVMLAIMSILSLSLKEMMDERDNVVAIMLAQEGVELARNIRDSNWADRVGVTATTPAVFDNFPMSDSNPCIIDYNDGAMGPCNNSLDFRLRINGFYSHDGVTNFSKFRRRMNLNYNGANAGSSTELKVTALVSWDNVDPPSNPANCTVANKCVFSEATLTDWGTGL